MPAKKDTGIIRLNPADNVVVCLRAIPAGTDIGEEGVVTREAIPFGHKIATRAIAAGEAVRKYGQLIGAATKDIPAGAHVHVQNVATTTEREKAVLPPPFHSDEAPRTFMGFKRPDGRVGTRNYIAVLSNVNCSATVARQIALQAESRGLLQGYDNIDGIVPIVHPYGCGMPGQGPWHDQLLRTLWGTASNPNFAAVLLVGLGCEVLQIAHFRQTYGLKDSERFRSYTIQDVGGTRRAVEEGLKRLAEMLPAANRAQRTEQPASALTVGLQCGASDAWSGMTANPALGNACDRLVELGGTVILSETPEIYGAEHLLYARAASPEIADALKARIAWWTEYTRRNGVEMNNNPSPGNKAGGITTILEKSLGAIVKAGTSPLNEVLEYAAPITKRGLVYMDSPGYDPCSATGQVASGANLIAFTTGRGSAFGCKPTPSLKLASNTPMFDHMRDDMDINCGTILSGDDDIESKGSEILELLLATASGQHTRSECLGYGDEEFVPWHISAIM